MQELRDRVAVVTGAGSGIGRGIAHAFADEGAHIAVLDVERTSAELVAAEIRQKGVRAIALSVDVADPQALESAAEAVAAELGAVHVLCNNAGVWLSKPLAECTAADWDWLVSVNLLGPVNGVRAFLPYLTQNAEGYIVNTASLAGLFPVGGPLGIYTATKYAVVAFSEMLRSELAPQNIGVSVLCPGRVNTEILSAGRNRQDRFGGSDPEPPPADHAARMRRGMDPLNVGRLVVQGLKSNRLYILTSGDARPTVEERCRRILADFEGLPNERTPPPAASR